MTTKVSVIVCTFNRCDSLAGTLASLRALEVPPALDWEILVVDNNSSDRTRAVVEEFAHAAPVPTRYIFEPRQGLSHARNRGVAESDRELILFTDDDVLVDPQWLHHTADALLSGGAGCAGGKVVPLWQGLARPSWLSNRMLNVLAMLDYGDGPAELGCAGDDRILYGANFAFRRGPLLEAGAFNPDLGRKGAFGAGEDKEIQEKLRQLGHKVFYEPRSVVFHRVDRERLSKKYFRLWHYNAGKDRARITHRSRLHVFGIESYLLREFVQTAAKMLGALVVMNRQQAFEAQLRCILYLSIFKHKLRRAFAGGADRAQTNAGPAT